MNLATVRLKSTTTYSQSRYLPPELAKKEDEDWNDYEERVWRDKAHINDDGYVFIPAMQLQFAIAASGRFMKMKVKGEGNARYGAYFESGILITDDIVLDIKKEDTRGQWFPCHADGKRGSGTRVPRKFPMMDKWEATVQIYVLNPKLFETVVREHIKATGNFMGIGRFRPSRGGTNGRFTLEDMAWEEYAPQDEAAA